MLHRFISSVRLNLHIFQILTKYDPLWTCLVQQASRFSYANTKLCITEVSPLGLYWPNKPQKGIVMGPDRMLRLCLLRKRYVQCSDCLVLRFKLIIQKKCYKSTKEDFKNPRKQENVDVNDREKA